MRARAPTSAASCSPATAHPPRTVAGPSARAATSASAARTATSTEGDAAGVDPARLGPAAHPRGAAADPVHAQGRHRSRAPGWAVGGGHSLHVVCDMTIASEEHAVFKQTDADVASFDGGYGSALLARQVGQKRAREIFFLGRDYSALAKPSEMGAWSMRSFPHADLEKVALEWAREEVVTPRARPRMRMLKYAFNHDRMMGLVGQQLFAGRGHPPGVWHRGGPRRPGRIPRKAAPGLQEVPLAPLGQRLSQLKTTNLGYTVLLGPRFKTCQKRTSQNGVSHLKQDIRREPQLCHDGRGASPALW